jgi:hypothetical protein
MERNPNDNFGASAGQGGASGSDFESTSGGFAGAGGTAGTSSAAGGFGSTGGTGSPGGTATEGPSLRESARGRLGQAKEKAGEIKTTLADKLEAGAQRLQQRSGKSGTVAGATADGSTAALTTQPDAMAKASDKVASGMRNTADWLRNNDLDTMREGVEKEVRTNPGRSLLVAAVAGYLLGKAFRR